MGKFEKYTGKVSFVVDGENFDLKLIVKDRIALAAIHDLKNIEQKYDKMFEYCAGIIQREYPNENKENIDAFLSRNIDMFINEMMIGAGWAKREDINRVIENQKKETIQ